MAKKVFKHIKKFLPLIGIAIFFYIIYTLDIQDIKHAFLSIPASFIFLSAIITIPRAMIRTYSWRIIQKEQKINLTYSQTLKILLIGVFYGCITPGYTGQTIRIPYMKEKTGDPYGKLFINTFIETAIHTSSLYIMLFFGSLIVIQTFPQIFYASIIWIAIFFGALIYFIGKKRGEKLLTFFIKYFIPKKVKEPLYDFVGTFYEDFPKIKRLAIPFILGIVTWVLIFTQYYILIMALDLDIPYLYFLLLFPVANVISFIPISLAGLGTRELAAVILFTTLFTVSAAEIFVVSLLGFLLTDMSMGLAGFFVSLNEAKKE